MAQISIVRKSQLEGAMRLDAEYYQPKYLQLNRSLMAWKGGIVKKLSAIGTVEYGFMPMEDYAGQDEGEPLIRVTSILGNLLVDMDDVKFIRNGLASSRKRVKHGDVLVVQCGDTTGKIAFISSELDNFVFPSFCLRVRTQELVPEYLAAFLNSRLGQSQIMRGITYATVRPNTTKPNIQNILVAIPPEEIQHQVAMAVSSAFAETKRSKVLYLQAEQFLLDELGFKHLDLSRQLCYSVLFKKTKEAKRLDAEYFQPKYDRVMALLGRSGQQIGDVAKLRKDRFKPNTGESFNYIEISNLDVNGHADSETFMGEDAPSRATWVVRANDVITSTVRPIRRLSALVEPQQDGFVCSSGFAVLKATAIAPEVLLVFLRLPIICEILDLMTTASMYPAIPIVDLLATPIALPRVEAQQHIVQLITDARRAGQNARKLLEEAKNKVENLIEGSA